MTLDKSIWGAFASTSLFMLLWSSGAIFARLGLDHASPFAFLTLRFALAFTFLLLVCTWRGRGLPERGSRLKVAGIGLLLIGGYTICYLLALDNGVTPGVLAALLGVQPILTLVLLERRFALMRLLGLAVALGGLVLLVWQSIGQAQLTRLGLAYGLASLGSMTLGAILQKSVQQAPMQLLPLQYGASLLACLLLVPYKPFHFEVSPGLRHPTAVVGAGDLGVGATAALPADASGQPGERHQPVLPGARGHGGDGLPVPRQQPGAPGSGGNGRDTGRAGTGVRHG